MTLPDFPSFYAALHGRAPFAWQARAAGELRETGWWDALTAPTGAGKTTLIEAWLHALAMAGPERLGRRLFWVVDRRAVIDQAFGHADTVIAKLLAEDTKPALSAVAGRLREIGGDADPVCALWRGGLDEAAGREAQAPLDPGRVACVCSTVDQVGSRLLFRGYGIAPGSRAIHAGIAGIDATVVLDEAHIATDFRATADAVGRLQSRSPQSPGPPLRVVEVTATPRRNGGFTLTADERAEAAIARRLVARKRVRLARRGRIDDAVKAATMLAGGDPHTAVGIILNTVGEARAVFDGLAAAGIASADRTLVIGPIRPLDRSSVLARIPERAERGARTSPFFVVATQTIEVGLDLDLDALVTACAPIPALVQRLGRLDRAGAVGDSEAVVLPPPARGCPVYGEATADAFRWLQERSADADLDLGPDAIERLRASAPWPEPIAPRPAPVLQTLHVEALARTGASEGEVPEIELFLHGDRETSTDVAFVWRADVEEGDDRDRVADRLGLRPPHPGEMLTVSLRAAVRWLSGRDAGTVADLPSADDAPPGAPVRRQPRSAWVVGRSGHDSPEVAPVALGTRPLDAAVDGGRAARLRPGDVVVLASAAGGADEYGWAPDSTSPVADLGSLDRVWPRVVLSERVAGVPPHRVARALEALEEGDLSSSAAARELTPLVRLALPAGQAYAAAVREVVERLAGGWAEPLPDGEILLTARGPGRRARAGAAAVTLAAHQGAVSRRVAEIAAAVGLAPEIAEQVQLAAAHHDEGKRDPRFQSWLSAGSAVAEPLAKSSYVPTRRRLHALREAAGWPEGKRHEIASALLVRQALPGAVLAAWLVATHHGANRPFPHAVPDDGASHIELAAPIDGVTASVTADAGLDVALQLDAFERLSAAFGPWGLAFLEAILVFADREVSGAGG